MTPVPAAVADSSQDPALADLHGRMEGFLERSDRVNGERLAGRLLPAQPSESSGTTEAAFHWLLIPEWLAEGFGLTSTAAGRALVDDLCWIQFCVYGLFRAQDDLVDGDVEDPLLAVESNQLLVEAATCAARHFEGSSAFWEVFRETLDATSRAMVELDRVQRSPERCGERDLELYADLSGCLKIATAGVAIATGREREWRDALSPALDRLAVAAQVLDDVYDLRDDLAAGRINYAAWYLGRPVFGSTPEATEAVVASNLATTGRLGALLSSARALVDEAAKLVSPTLCAGTHSYLLDYGSGIAELARQLEISRADLFRA